MKNRLLHKFWILFFMVFPAISFSQSTQGPNNPVTVTTGACTFSYSSTLAYAPATNVNSSNNSYASVTHCACCDANTNCLKASNFGFSISATATITGITVRIEKRASAGAIIQDNGLRLVKGGVEVGSSLHVSTNWPFSDGVTVYGGCSNLWGTTWTPAEVNSNTFGVFFASIDYTCGGNTQSFIDHVQVTVCYLLTLPVELNYFEAVRTNNRVELNWQTLSEQQNDRFIVECSEDGIHFTEITSVPGAGNSTIPVSYSYIDDEPNDETRYYRLSQRDFNGKTEIFSPVEVDDEPGLLQLEHVHWNENNLSVRINSEARLPVYIRIYSLTGEQVCSFSGNLNKGENELTFPTDITSKGFYTVSVQPGNYPAINQLIYSAE